jgi:hypothetical protein
MSNADLNSTRYPEPTDSRLLPGRIMRACRRHNHPL